MDSKSSLQNLFLPFCTQGVCSTVHSTHFYVWTCPKERQFSFQQMSDELNVNDTLRAELTACYLGLMLRGWRIHFCVEFTICKSPLICLIITGIFEVEDMCIGCFSTWIQFCNLKHFYYSLIIWELAFGPFQLMSSRCLPGTLSDNSPNYSIKIKQK